MGMACHKIVILIACAQQNCDIDDDVSPPEPLPSTFYIIIMIKTPATCSVRQHGDLQHNLTSENTADTLMYRFKK